jgi:butyrate kinase
LITGGIANDNKFVSFIQEYVHKIAPVFVYPGEDEMRALAMNGLLLIKGELQAKVYK